MYKLILQLLQYKSVSYVLYLRIDCVSSKKYFNSHKDQLELPVQNHKTYML